MASPRQQGLLDDLRYLRKGPGLTLARLARATAVVAACGGSDQPMETVRERLLSAVRSLPDGREPAALAAALNGAQNGAPLLKARREAHAVRVGRAPYTVAEWEDRALDELALRLLTSYYAGSATPAQLHVPHGGFLLRRLEVRTLIRDRRFVESRQVREVVSLVDGAKGFVYGTYSPTVLTDSAAAPCDPVGRSRAARFMSCCSRRRCGAGSCSASHSGSWCRQRRSRTSRRRLTSPGRRSRVRRCSMCKGLRFRVCSHRRFGATTS